MNASTTLQVTGITQIAVMVEDLARASAFYRDILGLEPLFEVPGMGFFQTGSIRLMLGLEPDAEKRKHTSILYFQVANAAAAEQQLRAQGVEIISPAHLVARMHDHELWLAFFRDSEGHMMGLMAEQRE